MLVAASTTTALVGARRRAGGEGVEAREALTLAASRWANAAVNGAFSKWADVWAAGVRAKALMRRAVARALNQMLAKVFLAWSAHVRETVSQREAARLR